MVWLEKKYEFDKSFYFFNYSLAGFTAGCWLKKQRMNFHEEKL